MTLGRVRTLGAATVLAALSATIPGTAIAGDPLPTTNTAWVDLTNNDGKLLTGGDAAPGLPGFVASSISQFQFQLVKVGNGPLESLTQMTIERPRGQYDQPFKLPMGAKLGQLHVALRKAAVGAQADWFYTTMYDPKVVADEVRTKAGQATSTEVLIVSFSKVLVSHRVQTAEGYGTFAAVPPQFDVKDTVELLPAPTTPTQPTQPTNPVTPIVAQPIRVQQQH